MLGLPSLRHLGHDAKANNRAARLPGRVSRCRRGCQRNGLSLLEVILAIAILGGAVAAIGVCVRIGTQAATDAREMTMAQLLCESKLAELVSGLAPVTNVSGVPMEIAPDWQYTVQSQPSSQNGLLLIAVTVQRDPAFNSRPVSVTLYRWLIDPQLAAQLESPSTTQSNSSGTTSSGNTSGSSSGGTTGGTSNG